MSVEAIETRNAVAIHSRACLKATSDGHRHAATIPPSSTAHRSLITRHFLLPLHRQSVSLPAIMQRRSYLPPSSPALPSCPPNPKGRRRGRTTQDRGWKIVDRGKVARHRRGRMRMERGRSDRNGTHCLTPVSTPASHPLRFDSKPPHGLSPFGHVAPLLSKTAACLRSFSSRPRYFPFKNLSRQFITA
jgi:hypothetical protein